jgi:hypothetical protein
VHVLHYLLPADKETPCQKAADADDSSALDVTDATRILTRVFLDAKPLAEHLGGCGPDPTPDELTCEAYAACSD